jgi:hypothetical protein
MIGIVVKRKSNPTPPVESATIHLSESELVRLFALCYMHEGGSFIVPDDYHADHNYNSRLCRHIAKMYPEVVDRAIDQGLVDKYAEKYAQG